MYHLLQQQKYTLATCSNSNIFISSPTHISSVDVRVECIILQLELSSSPVTSLCIVSDLVSGLHSYPLWYRSIHVHLMCKFALDFERLVRSHVDSLVYRVWNMLTYYCGDSP